MPKIHYFWLVCDHISEIKIVIYLKLQKDGRVFASSALWRIRAESVIKFWPEPGP